MRTFLLNDSINQLHWNVLKSVVMILTLLPLSHVLLNTLQQVDGSSRIVFGFMFVSVFISSCLVAFNTALHSTIRICQEAETRSEKMLFNIYKQVPMLFFTAIILLVVTKI